MQGSTKASLSASGVEVTGDAVVSQALQADTLRSSNGSPLTINGKATAVNLLVADNKIAAATSSGLDVS